MVPFLISERFSKNVNPLPPPNNTSSDLKSLDKSHTEIITKPIFEINTIISSDKLYLNVRTLLIRSTTFTTGRLAVTVFNSRLGTMEAYDNTMAPIINGVIAFCASLKLCANEHTHMLIAEITKVNTQIQIKVIISGKISLDKSIFITNTSTSSLAFKIKKTILILIESKLIIALTNALSDTAKYFPITNSKLDIGSVKSVSNVPRSFSPAIISIAG